MFTFENLDSVTRKYMVEEIELASKNGDIYFSTRFNIQNDSKWVSLLIEAANSNNEHWLAYQLEANNMMKDFEGSRTPSGGYTTKHVPHTASQTLADGQFNRFYIVALCRRAIEEKITHVTVYRAKESTGHRTESDALIGSNIEVSQLLQELRKKDTSFRNKLIRPNSGLSVKL